MENWIHGYSNSEDSSFFILNVTDDFLAVRPILNPISSRRFVEIFDNKDLFA